MAIFKLKDRGLVEVDKVDFTRTVRAYNKLHPEVSRRIAYDQVARLFGCDNHLDLRSRAKVLANRAVKQGKFNLPELPALLRVQA